MSAIPKTLIWFRKYFTLKERIVTFLLSLSCLTIYTLNKEIAMHKLDNNTIHSNALLRNMPQQDPKELITNSNKTAMAFNEKYEVKLRLESIHYTGKDHGYGWTFVISTLKRHWVSKRIHIQRGRKSLVNRDTYHNTIDTSFYTLQHLPITICAQHVSGFRVETTLRLKPSLFRHNLLPTSIDTNVDPQSGSFCFHELHSVTHQGAKLMFVLNFEITPKESSGYKN